MGLRNFLSKNLMYPSYELLTGTKIQSKYRFLLKSQWWEKEEIKEYQNKKLSNLIKHSYNNVEYYRKLFRENNINPNEIKTAEDLKKIPPLTKDDVRKFGLSSLIAKNIPSRKIIKGTTGGSTGEPLQFYRDKNSKSWGLGALHRFWNWSGINFAEKKFQFSGGSLGGFLTKRSKLYTRFEKFMTGTYVFPAFEMYEKNLERYLEIMTKNKDIKFLRGYSSSIFILAKYINNYGIDNNLELNAVLTTAEKLFDYQKEEIQKAFNCTVYDQYGCGEILSIAAHCSNGSLYHIAEEHVILEIDDYKKKNVARITDLDNYISPFIRYENGDIITPSNKICACGRELSTLSKIDGRTHDFITTRNGDLIAGEFFPHLFQSVIGVDQYFIYQKSIYLLIISIKPNKDFIFKELTPYINKIKEYVGEDMTVEINLVEDIPLTKTGKRLFIKSDVPLEFKN